ncbi:MAG: hypothetical protein PHD95_00495 [Candidatus ainarchaeum sp.]|nr:hypothetical protein [Candidatus ainarchaeum sp.]
MPKPIGKRLGDRRVGLSEQRVKNNGVGLLPNPKTGAQTTIYFREGSQRFTNDEPRSRRPRRRGTKDRRIGSVDQRVQERRKKQAGISIRGDKIYQWVKNNGGTFFDYPRNVIFSEIHALVISQKQFARHAKENRSLLIAGKGKDWVAIWDTRIGGRDPRKKKRRSTDQ